MLVELIIRNFAIIDHLQVGFGTGFSVLTGETGAGKSIIIDAVGLLLGDRARPDLIRSGEDEATVEALFDISGQPELCRDLAEAGFDAEGELLIKRVVSRAGKNRVYINGSLSRLGQLEPVTSRLLAIYGQHEHQQLQRSELHLPLLDRFARLNSEVSAYEGAFGKVADLEDRLANLTGAERQRQQRLDLLSFQAAEIAAAGLRDGEEEELAAERLLLQNAGRLAAAAEEGFDALYGGDGAACERIAAVAERVEGLKEIEPLFGPVGETIRSSLYALEDAARELRDYAARMTFDPERLTQVEERLAQLALLKRKYATDIAGILRYKDNISREIEELGQLESMREALLQQLAAATADRQRTGEALAAARRREAVRLQQAVETELADLAMHKARFAVHFTALEQPGPSGLERGEFFLSANPGEEPRPLAFVASGGELSRIMLALNRAAPQEQGIPTLVFDEVDAGIGGAAATAVGEKLQKVAAGRQVLCITHLPQVAAFADVHYRVEKRETSNRTVTIVNRLDGEERILEMARMLGGARVTDRTLEHAREIIAQSR